MLAQTCKSDRGLKEAISHRVYLYVCKTIFLVPALHPSTSGRMLRLQYMIKVANSISEWRPRAYGTPGHCMKLLRRWCAETVRFMLCIYAAGADIFSLSTTTISAQHFYVCIVSVAQSCASHLFRKRDSVSRS